MNFKPEFCLKSKDFVHAKDKQFLRKLIMNALIGKFAQRPTLSKVVFLKTQKELEDLFFDPIVKITYARLVRTGLVEVHYEVNKTFTRPNPHVRYLLRKNIYCIITVTFFFTDKSYVQCLYHCYGPNIPRQSATRYHRK